MGIDYDFSGRTAVVTGGSRGIGRGIATELRDAGAEVWNWDVEEAGNAGVRFCPVDVSSRADVAAAAAALPVGGTVDILVNNAGITGGSAAVESYDPDTWDRVLAVNLTGTFLVCKALLPAIRRSGAGRIVNIASLAGKEGTPQLSAYAASKAGIIAFTKALGREVADSEIRVNCIAPAALRTDILDQLPPEAVETMIRKSPLGRLGTVEELAGLVLWLCSEACSFSTGATFDLSGGRASY